MPGKGKELKNQGNAPLLTNVGNQSAFGPDFSTWVNYPDNLLDPYLVLWFLNMSHMRNSTVWGIIFASVKGGYFWISSYFSSFQSQWHRCSRMRETGQSECITIVLFHSPGIIFRLLLVWFFSCEHLKLLSLSKI